MYGVPIIVHGREAKVAFRTKHEKFAYLDKERVFCKKEIYTFIKATSNRIAARDTLAEKRVSFAKHMGYVPSIENRNIWVKVSPRKNIIA